MFKKILIANRGEIALRVIRACRELGISTVAVHSDIDRDSLHVKLADESVCIGPAPARASYLSVRAILSAAEITNADAIHPGYGFLAENAEFASICKKCDIRFIGPEPEEIELMGDKIRSREAMRKAGLNLLPSLTVSGDNTFSETEIEAIGFPIIVKASAGGGGKGIKIVRARSEIASAIATARAEAKAAFGDPTVYVEKYLERGRHIEFQIVSDGKNIVHLGERDCSIQRRYQKVMEEAPCLALSDKNRFAVGATVTQSLKKLGYSNVGTVEFLMDEHQKFYFLEMNTRIQVEHPITEAITGLDLMKLQIELAAGRPLPFAQQDVKFMGHAIEMRINAEDSERMLPSVGRIDAIHIPGGPGVRVDNGVYNGFYVSPYYDSLLAKLIIRGVNREECISRADASLREFHISGVRTNIPIHQRILNDAAFKEGKIHIRYLDNLMKS